MTIRGVQPLSPADRRVQPRASFRGEVVLCLKEGLQQVPLRDISARGLGVLLPHELGKQSRLIVELFDHSGHFWYRKGLEVVHVTPYDGNAWLIGSVFLQEFSLEELQGLIG